MLSAEDHDLADTEDTDSSVPGARRRYVGGRGGMAGVGVVNGAYTSTSNNRHVMDDRRMTSARRANAVSATRRISSVTNLQQVCHVCLSVCQLAFCGGYNYNLTAV